MQISTYKIFSLFSLGLYIKFEICRFFIDTWHVIHFPNVNFNEKFTIEQINTSFFNISHIAKQ